MDQLEINASRIRLLEDNWRRRWNRAPTQSELQNLVDAWIHEEVLYREALRRGLDRNDEIVRRRLVQKMENLSYRLSWSEPPTGDELETFYSENQERFRLPARRSFTHIFFSHQKRGDRAKQDALEALTVLNDALSSTPPGNLGDRSMLAKYFAQVSEGEVRPQFGPEFAASLFEVEQGTWRGPIKSAYGQHLIYIHDEISSHMPPLDEIKDTILEALINKRQGIGIERLYQSFRENYEISFNFSEARDFDAEIEVLAETWLMGQEDKQESKTQLSEIYNKVNAILPPRYQGRVDEVSAALMSAADLEFDDEGNVAWDKIWGKDDPNQPFCELAIAGGPPHRGTLLEPVSPEEAMSDLDLYGYVIHELARGITMVTGRSVVSSRTPGWIGVVCDSEEMAIWVLRGIIVENVMVRREGDVLYMPASPKYSLKGEIKNVVTACAKVFHYWNEHIAALQDQHEA